MIAQPQINSQVKRYASHTFSIEEGLSQSSVNCIIKDKRGFIWLGTEDGLNRYDGNEFTIFSSKDRKEVGLLNNAINCLLEDRTNNLIYIGTNGGGLSVFNPVDEHFTHYVYDGSENCISSGFVYDLCFDNDSNVIVASTYGISIFNVQDKTFDNFEISESNNGEFPYVAATSVLSIKDNEIWAGTYGQGLIKINTQARSYRKYPIPNNDDHHSNSNIIEKIKRGQDNQHIWLATDGGFYEYDINAEEFQLLHLKDTKVSDIAVDKQGGIWLSCGLNGVTHVLPDGRTEQFQNDPFDVHSLKENFIRCLFIDDRQHLWLGTKSSGCIHMDISNNQFVHYYQTKDGKGLNGGNVFALCNDNNNNLWIGTMKGLTVLDTKSSQLTTVYPLGEETEISVWALLQQNEIMWVGTSRGLLKYNTITEDYCIYDYSKEDSLSLPDNEVFAIEKDKNGNIWVGTAFGYARFNTKDETFERFPFINSNGSHSNEMVWDIMEDSQNRIWITTAYGINLYLPESDSLMYLFGDDFDKTNLTSSSVNSIYEDSQHRIWLATRKGICLLSNDRTGILKSYGINEGLTNPYTYRLLEHNNHLWASSNSGIFCINIDNDEIYRYDIKDGLQSNEFNIACEKLADGRFAFGGINGFNVFHPDLINQSKYSPPIYFTSLELFGHSINVRDSISLENVVMKNSLIYAERIQFEPDERFFTLNFSALDYQESSQVHYFYRMLPNSKEWIPLKNKRNLTFINLNTGNYQLEVRSTNAEGYQSNNTKSINIVILPPLWKKAWFISLILLITVLMTYLAARLYYLKNQRDKRILEKRVQLRTKEFQLQRNIAHRQRDEIARQKEELENFAKNLEGIVDKRTKELLLAKEAAEESDRLKSAFLSNMSHEIRTPMNAIMGFSELLLDNSFSSEEKNDFAHLIKTNGDNLLHLLNDIIDISMIESGQLKVAFKKTNVTTLVKVVFESFKTAKSLADKNNFRFELDCIDEAVYVNTDSFRLRQILNNLISNALKFTESGFVKVKLAKEENFARFCVEDSGIGISEEYQSRIFDRFLKVDNKSSDLYAGNGLGLTITKNLVELLNGTIGLKSKPGKGTYFYFKLPICNQD